MEDSKVSSMWTEFKVLVDSMEKDMEKNAEKSNVSAGIRVRKGLREMRKSVSALLKETLVSDKTIVEARKKEKVVSVPSSQ